MFGKKKPAVDQVRDFHCGVCGINCGDDERLVRHVSWAHPGSQTVRMEKKEQPVASGKKA